VSPLAYWSTVSIAAVGCTVFGPSQPVRMLGSPWTLLNHRADPRVANNDLPGRRDMRGVIMLGTTRRRRHGHSLCSDRAEGGWKVCHRG
jgi:hypothetical protein